MNISSHDEWYKMNKWARATDIFMQSTSHDVFLWSRSFHFSLLKENDENFDRMPNDMV